MLTIVRMLASKAGWFLASFAIVILALALWNELPAKLRHWHEEASAWNSAAVELQNGQAGFEGAAASALRQADAEIVALKRSSDAQLARAEEAINKRRTAASTRILNNAGIIAAVLTGRADKVLASYRAQYIEVPLLDRAVALIKVRRANFRARAAWLGEVLSYRKAAARQNADVTAFYVRLNERDAMRRRAKTQWRDPICQRIESLPGCTLVREVRQRDLALAQDQQELLNRKASLDACRHWIDSLRLRREEVGDGAVIVREALSKFRNGSEHYTRFASQYALNRAWAALSRYGAQAFWIVLGAILLPIAHKLFAFQVIAPFAARAQPVRLRQPASPLIASLSAVSVAVPIGPDTELLLRSGLQSSAVDVEGRDKWVLDGWMPFTCIAAGLVNLQRLRSARSDSVTVTGTNEDQRVATIVVPVGGAMVLHPRALIGVVKLRKRRLIVTRPWRIRWLISWITAQLRYIVFHGPCTLIVQGRGGIQVENAARGRMINKRLTLGFDAGLAYGAARSASFLPYLRGQTSLFNDQFHGSGLYLYEQRADGGSGGGLWGRGLKGLSDAVLNVLGI